MMLASDILNSDLTFAYIMIKSTQLRLVTICFQIQLLKYYGSYSLSCILYPWPICFTSRGLYS